MGAWMIGEFRMQYFHDKQSGWETMIADGIYVIRVTNGTGPREASVGLIYEIKQIK